MVGRSASLVVLAGLVVGCVTHAAAQPADPPARVPAGKVTSAAGSFSARSPDSTGFRVLPGGAELITGDLLVLLPGATLESANKAVGLKCLADYDGKSPLPVLDTALTLNVPKGADLDLTLDRGRVDLTNTKTDGAAVVKVRFWEATWTVTLDTPGTRVAVELCGRWPAGSRFKPDDKDAEPVASLVLLVLKGSAAADVGGVTLGLREPPGPAQVEWDSETGARPQPLKLEKLPDWADPEAALSADGKKVAAAVEKFRQARAENATAARRSFLDSADPVEQRVALVTLGATDDLEGLGRVLSGAKTPEQWEFGITILRHWLGRCPGNDQKLYAQLTSPAGGYTPVHARIIMQLLLGFSPDDLRRPETYEVLIEYLDHDLPAVRNLAAWHLVRLVPQGKSIAYKPGGTKAECEAAYKAWKKLVPAGQLPPEPKKD